MRVHTDDLGRRQEFVYYKAGFEARWSVIFACVFAFAATAPPASWLIWSVGRIAFSGPMWVLSSVLIGSAVTLAGVVGVAFFASKSITPTTPLSYHWEVLKAEAAAPRPRTGGVARARSMPIHVGRPECTHSPYESPDSCSNSASHK